jgi:hypothetical protein
MYPLETVEVAFHTILYIRQVYPNCAWPGVLWTMMPLEALTRNAAYFRHIPKGQEVRHARVEVQSASFDRLPIRRHSSCR